MPLADHATRTLSGAIWIASRPVAGSLGWLALALSIPLVALMIWRFPADLSARRRLPWIAILPAPWLFCAFWGAWFWVTAPSPTWVAWPLVGALGLQLALILGLAIVLRGSRVVAVAFGVGNLYLTLWCAFVAGMAVTGDWI
jgi:hypothetical protein